MPASLEDLDGVLILVLVEHTLRAERAKEATTLGGLNPCFSGTYSQSFTKVFDLMLTFVLILVLVEHTLREVIRFVKKNYPEGLNPCFSGTYSQRATFATNTISMHYAPKNGTYRYFLRKLCTFFNAKI